MPSTSTPDLSAPLSKLKLSTTSPSQQPTNPPTKKPTRTGPAPDAWDDDLPSSPEEEASPSDDGPTTPTLPSKPASHDTTAAPPPPPPTPASPGAHFSYAEHAMEGRYPSPYPYPSASPASSRPSSSSSSPATKLRHVTADNSNSDGARPARRPDKSTAAAGRLIAGALGVAAPRRGEAEREYERVVRERERRRREREREEERRRGEEGERARRAVWED